MAEKPVEPAVPPSSQRPLLVRYFISSCAPYLLLVKLPTVIFPKMLCLKRTSCDRAMIPGLIRFISPLRLVATGSITCAVIFPPFHRAISTAGFRLMAYVYSSSNVLFSKNKSGYIIKSTFQADGTSSWPAFFNAFMAGSVSTVIPICWYTCVKLISPFLYASVNVSGRLMQSLGIRFSSTTNCKSPFVLLPKQASMALPTPV